MPTLLSPLATDHIAFMHRIDVALSTRTVTSFKATFGKSASITFDTKDKDEFIGEPSMPGDTKFALNIKNNTIETRPDGGDSKTYFALHGAISLVLNASVEFCSDTFEVERLTIDEITFDDSARKKQLKTIAAYCLVHAALKSTLSLSRQAVVAAMQNLNDTNTSLVYVPVKKSNAPPAHSGEHEQLHQYAVLGEYRRRVLLTIADVKCNIERSVSTSNMSRSHYCITLQQVAILLPLLTKYSEYNGNYRHANVPTYWGINPSAMVNGNWHLHPNITVRVTDGANIPYVYIACLHLYFILFHGTAYTQKLNIPTMKNLTLPSIYQFVYGADEIEKYWQAMYCNLDGTVKSDLIEYFVNPSFTQNKARLLERAYCNNVCVQSNCLNPWHVQCIASTTAMDTEDGATINIAWQIDAAGKINVTKKPLIPITFTPKFDELVPDDMSTIIKDFNLNVITQYTYLQNNYDACTQSINIVPWILMFCTFVSFLPKDLPDEQLKQIQFTTENVAKFKQLLALAGLYCFANDRNDIVGTPSDQEYNFTVGDVVAKQVAHYKRYEETPDQSFYKNVFTNCDEWCGKVWALHHLYTNEQVTLAKDSTNMLQLFDRWCLYHPMLTTEIKVPDQFRDVVTQVLMSSVQYAQSLPAALPTIANASKKGYRFALTADESRLQSNSFCTVVPAFNVYTLLKHHDTSGTIDDDDILAHMFWHKYRCAE